MLHIFIVINPYIANFRNFTMSRSDTLCHEGSTKNFLNEYIFPGGQIPKIEWVLDCARRNNLKLIHLETIGGQHYAKTLHAWRDNLTRSRDVLIKKGYKEETYKAYEYYMVECEAAFFADQMQLSHFVFDKVVSTRDVKRDVW
jgi:cyclopropane fatty-acyl-phospholipid synthase-like methyltransferase